MTTFYLRKYIPDVAWKKSYRLSYNDKNIRNLVFIKIGPNLTEIKFQNKAVNIKQKG